MQPQSLAFFCSNACPGDIILQAQDWANARNPNTTPIIGGFHTPLEREVLRILLRNAAPLLYVLSSSTDKWKNRRDIDHAAITRAIQNGNLTLITPFEAKPTPATAQTAAKCNDHILSQTNTILIAHASQTGKTEQLARTARAQGKTLYTFPSPANANLIHLGALPLPQSLSP